MDPAAARTGAENEDDLVAALSGDMEAFRALTDRYSRELHLHCYRLLGSLDDAEDAVQETLLRAWRHLATFEARSTLRAWLYRIATNVSLTHVKRKRRDLPVLPKALAEAVARGNEPEIDLSPYPDILLDELESTMGDPAAQYDQRESIQLAFLAAVQVLPARQRAVFLLRDVLNFSTDEVAGMLETTAASVNGALHRARATIDRQRADGRLHLGRIVPTDDTQRSIVERYVEAWDAVDIRGLARLLKSDVVLTMPPLPVRYSGRDEVATFFATVPSGGALDRFRLIPTRANLQPALGAYRLNSDTNTYRAWGIWVLSLDGEAIAEITAFVDEKLFPRFRLPSEVDSKLRPV